MTRCSPSSIQRMAHSALRRTAGTLSIARCWQSFSAPSWTYISISSEYISEWMFSMARFSSTMPFDAAKKANTWEMKCRTSGLSRASNNHVLTESNGDKQTWNDLAHIQPIKCEIRVAPFLFPNTERSHSVLKN
jgi:hypothetical protein